MPLVLTGSLCSSASVLDHAVLTDPARGLAVLADGFGGGRESTGHLVAEAMAAFLKRGAQDQEITLPFETRTYCSLAGNVLCNAFVVANRKLRSLNSGAEPGARGGASAGALLVDGDRVVIARIGAVAVWLSSERGWVRLLAPDTLGELERPGGGESVGLGAPLSALGLQAFVEPTVVELRLRPGLEIALLIGETGESGVTQLGVTGAPCSGLKAAYGV